MSLTLAPVSPFLSCTTTVFESVVFAALSQVWSWGDIQAAACADVPAARAASATMMLKTFFTIAPSGTSLPGSVAPASCRPAPDKSNRDATSKTLTRPAFSGEGFPAALGHRPADGFNVRKQVRRPVMRDGCNGAGRQGISEFLQLDVHGFVRQTL